VNSSRRVALPAEPAGSAIAWEQPPISIGPLLGHDEVDMRSILMCAIGIPIPIILLAAFCTHHL